MSSEPRPAFYALAQGGWRDYVTLLHAPYTLWHLSYVAIGAALAPELEANRLLWGLAAFLLALGVGAHALDELHSRPLSSEIPRGVLVWLAAASLAGAVAIGIVAAFAWSLWLLPFVAVGAFLVPAYTLELGGGLFHTDLWFGLAWALSRCSWRTWARPRRCGPRRSSRLRSRCSRASRSARSRRRCGRCGAGSPTYRHGSLPRRARGAAGAGNARAGPRSRPAGPLAGDGRARGGARLVQAGLKGCAERGP